MNDDWTDLLGELLDAGARFLVVGAHALAIHGVPRATQDLDLWLDASPDNAARVWTALARFGAPLGSLSLSPADLTRPDNVIQFGLPPNRIDLLVSISGVSDFAAAWEHRVVHEVRGRAVPFLGRAARVANTRAAGRKKDLADLEALGEEG